MSQPPGEYYRNQPQVPPPWGNYPPASQAPPPRRPRRKNPGKRNAILLALGALLAIGVITAAVNGSGKPAKPLAATSGVAATAAASSGAAARASASLDATTKKEDACRKRPPASGDIYVRTITPGTSAQARQLGGGWAWDPASSKCLTSVQLVMATAPQGAGDCTQVGYAADNSGYDPGARPAAPLTQVAAHAGAACQAAPPPAPASPAPAPASTAPAAAPPAPAPAQTTPAAPPPPASAAPVACHPLTNGGNCYKPGEFCRNADHGVSGVAGDGEAITCEDNDGWRWEPA